jgi:cyclic pyranopterin phosphate synthase
MPEDPHFMAKKKLLSHQQIFEICNNLTEFGIDEIRLTGGEPLLRPDFLIIAERLSTLPLEKLALTTNALKLFKILPDLVQTNLKNINISLDSLDPKKFSAITKSSELKLVLDSISKALDLGFKVKINTVLLKGINDNEIEDFIQFSKFNNVEVRFLETMKIGEMLKSYDQYYLPVEKVIDQIKSKHSLTTIATTPDSTSFNYLLENGARIGFVASESKAFCGQCSRLRLGATGNLYPCLFVDEGPSLKNISISDYPTLLNNLMTKKPHERLALTNRAMHEIGG